jgi:4'-phosphopantetheinyl transferase
MNGKGKWLKPGDDHTLRADEVHVWRIGLDWLPGRIAELEQGLSQDEREKAGRFHFAIDRKRYVVGRGVLRRLLARCLDTRPDELSFDYSRFGKPGLASAFAQSQLQFNVSHSGDLVLVGLAVGRAIGIDIERIRTDVAVERIAERFFSPRERAALATLEPSRQIDCFFACWTRKEAYIKAHGEGLSLPLDGFDVSLLPAEEPRLLETRPEPAEAQRWVLRELDVGPGYRAALAVEGAAWHLRTWDWPSGSCPFGQDRRDKATGTVAPG